MTRNILLLLLIMAVCVDLYLTIARMSDGGNKKPIPDTNYEIKTDTTQVTKHRRYFMVGYDLFNGSSYQFGSMFISSDTMPCMSYFYKEVYDSRDKSLKNFSKNDMAILSFHEFKDSAEAFKFAKK